MHPSVTASLARREAFANPSKPFTLKRRLALALEWLGDFAGGTETDDEIVAVMHVAASAAIARRERARKAL